MRANKEVGTESVPNNRQSVSYYLGNESEQASLVWKDQYRYVGLSDGIFSVMAGSG